MTPPKPINHACFEVAMADLLGRAYEAFPAPLDLLFEELFMEAQEAGKMPGHCQDRFRPRGSLYGSTLDFLTHEGLLRAAEVDTYGGTGLTLTSKGFLVLNEPLQSLKLEGRPTLGQKLLHGAQKAGASMLSTVISEIVKNLVKQG